MLGLGSSLTASELFKTLLSPYLCSERYPVLCDTGANSTKQPWFKTIRGKTLSGPVVTRQCLGDNLKCLNRESEFLGELDRV